MHFARRAQPSPPTNASTSHVPSFLPAWLSAAGFPRIGSKRQLKTALEDHWAGKLDEHGLRAAAAAVDAAAWEDQAAAGLDRIAVDGTLYDHVLDVTWALGLAPRRFHGLKGLALYFAMARGAKGGVPALDMSKLYDTNYHYMARAERHCASQHRP